jgi:transposase InsO family protein
MDFVGPLPETARGHRFLLTFIDTFSNWAEAIPVPDSTSAALAEAMYESLICRHGVPNFILTDRGRQFVGNMNTNFMTLLGVKHLRTTAYSPNANGICERMHRYIGQQLRTLSNTELNDWDKHIHAIMFTYRNGILKATGNSPYFLLHGRDPRLPEAVLSQDFDEIEDHAKHHLLPQILRLRKAHDEARRRRQHITEQRLCIRERGPSRD